MQLTIEKACDIFNIKGIFELKKYSDNEIRKLYHKLCLKFHPDKTQNGDTQTFIDIHNAYNVILEYRKNENEVFDSNEQRIYNFFIGLFNDETVNNVMNIIEKIFDKNATIQKKLPTITYHVTMNQVMNKEVFFHTTY
jgi:DnaJ-class molecular chaperone